MLANMFSKSGSFFKLMETFPPHCVNNVSCVTLTMNNQPHLLLTITQHLTTDTETDVIISENKKYAFHILPIRFSERPSPRLSKVLRILAFAYPYLFDNIPLFYRVSFIKLYSTLTQMHRLSR